MSLGHFGARRLKRCQPAQSPCNTANHSNAFKGRKEAICYVNVLLRHTGRQLKPQSERHDTGQNAAKIMWPSCLVSLFIIFYHSMPSSHQPK